ncbi:MAG: hypothetical protein HY833_02635 [Candidatus Aenigmarchaeota archaeon]|nr:hypothetical protein [Candidatus Aenigmarchaeota archaeon]
MEMEYTLELPKKFAGDEIAEIIGEAASSIKWRYEEIPCFSVTRASQGPKIESYGIRVHKGGVLSRIRDRHIVFQVSSNDEGYHDYPEDRIRGDGVYSALVMYGYRISMDDLARFVGSFDSIVEEKMENSLK